MQVSSIYVTHKNRVEAEKIAEDLLQKKLVACVNYSEIESAYWWKGEIVQDKETVTVFKTRTELWGEVKNAIEEIHPYEIPCIIKTDVESNDAYAEWVYNETSSAA